MRHLGQGHPGSGSRMRGNPRPIPTRCQPDRKSRYSLGAKMRSLPRAWSVRLMRCHSRGSWRSRADPCSSAQTVRAQALPRPPIRRWKGAGNDCRLSSESTSVGLRIVPIDISGGQASPDPGLSPGEVGADGSKSRRHTLRTSPRERPWQDKGWTCRLAGLVPARRAKERTLLAIAECVGCEIMADHRVIDALERELRGGEPVLALGHFAPQKDVSEGRRLPTSRDLGQAEPQIHASLAPLIHPSKLRSAAPTSPDTMSSANRPSSATV